MTITSYDPKKETVNVAGRVLTGYASDGIITVSKSEDSFTPNVGTQGDVVIEENANESGTIAITLQQTSSSLPHLRSLAANRTFFSVVISDSYDDDEIKISASNCRIMKMPDVVRGKNSSTVTVNIYVPNLVIR